MNRPTGEQSLTKMSPILSPDAPKTYVVNINRFLRLGKQPVVVSFLKRHTGLLVLLKNQRKLFSFVVTNLPMFDRW